MVQQLGRFLRGHSLSNSECYVITHWNSVFHIIPFLPLNPSLPYAMHIFFKTTTKVHNKTAHLKPERHWSKQGLYVYIKRKLPATKPLLGQLSKMSSMQFQDTDWQSTECIPSFKALSWQLSWVLIWPNHLWGSSELEPTGAELGFITASPVLAQFSLCSISVPLYSSVPCRHGTEMRASSLVLHITPWPQFVIFHTRWSLLWNEMSFPKMKRHKSPMINLLVRLLQLSPVEDIWTADWLMPAVGLEHGSLSLITDPIVRLSVGF